MTGLSRREFLIVSLLGATSRMPNGAASAQVSEATYGLAVMPRTTWATDRPSRGALPPEEVRFLLVHHTATPNDYGERDVEGLLRGFYDYHTGGRKGWNDIAYNFLIDRFGRVWEGRSGSLDGPVAGDASGGNQGYTQLVAIIGNFMETRPSEESIATLIDVLAWLGDRYDIDTRPGANVEFISQGSNRWPSGDRVTSPTIAGHRDMSLTACPGDAFYPFVVEELTAAVDLRRQAVALNTTTKAPTTTSSITTSTMATTPTSRVPLAAQGSATQADTEPGGVRLVLTGFAGAFAAAVVAVAGFVTVRRSRSQNQ